MKATGFRRRLHRVLSTDGSARWLPGRFRPASVLGVAVAPDRLVAVSARRTIRGVDLRTVLDRALEDSSGSGRWPELAEALAELHEALPAGVKRLHVALLPPLARTKGLSVPPVGRRDLRRLMRADARRHFLAAPPDDLLADAIPVERRRWRGPVRVAAACARRRDVERVRAAVGEADFEAGLVTSASWAAAQAVATLHRPARRSDVVLEIRAPDWTESIHLRRGRPYSFEPRREDGGSGPEVARNGRERATRLRPGEAPLEDLEAEVLAAFGALATPADAPTLLPPEEAAGRLTGLRRRAGLIAAAALLLFSAAAWLHLHGLGREVAALAARRAAIAEEVERARAARRAATELQTLLAAVEDLERRRASRTEVLASLAGVLPRSAHLKSVGAAGDTVRITGVASAPAWLVSKIESAPLLRRATLHSSQEGAGGGGDAFAMTFTLTPPEAERR